jgi:hypothetical protein
MTPGLTPRVAASPLVARSTTAAVVVRFVVTTVDHE